MLDVSAQQWSSSISARDVVKRVLGRKVIDRVKYTRDQARLAALGSLNRVVGYTKLDIGAGANAEAAGWWTGDVQTGFTFDENTELPFRSASIEFVYSSMFFEHIDDATAKAILSEARRVLKPGACFRIAVPDFSIYIKAYRDGDKGFFYSEANPNFKTWAAMGVPLDMEHLLLNGICALHNIDHEMVRYPSFEDFNATPAKVYHPFQDRLPGYYCGPAPGISTDEIKDKLAVLNDHDFVEWVFGVTNALAAQYATFNSFHKNQWSFEKLDQFARDAGFSKVVESSYLEAPHSPGPRREKPQHAKLGRYFNLFN